MIIEITIPAPGESITEVELANWLVDDGDYVNKDQEIAEVESDKATLSLIAEKAGKIKILVETGQFIKVGTVACTIDTSFTEMLEKKDEDEAKIEAGNKKKEGDIFQKIVNTEILTTQKDKELADGKDKRKLVSNDSKIKVTPLARKLMKEYSLDIDDIAQGLKKITTREVNLYLANRNYIPEDPMKRHGTREVKRESMSQLRKKLSQRLVAVKNETAMLSTFNEVDMSEVIRLRKEYQQQFTDAHAVKLGFMSFFVKAATEALLEFPRVNSMIDGDEIIVPQYVDISIAVQTDKGLMVPILRNTETMSFAEIEKNIQQLADKARNFKLSIEEMSGGTFSITNGGIFGSMLSTPILNPPQSAILAMHNIIERPVAIDGKVKVRPVMYVALSYDHRIIDGRDSVSFLVRIKEQLESPCKTIFGGQNPAEILL